MSRSRVQAPSRAPRRLFIHLPAELDERGYRARWEAGSEPDESPYGFHHARDLGWSVRFSTSARKRGGFRALLRGWIRARIWGVDLGHAWENRRNLNQADVVWTMLEQEALALAVLMRLRLIRRVPIISSTVWIIDHWTGFRPGQQRLLRGLVEEWRVLAVHAAPCLDIARRELPGVRSRLLHFGVSASAFPITPPASSGGDVLQIFAMGNDRTRDWATLIEAFGNDERFRIDLVCGWFTVDEEHPVRNLTVVHQPDMARMRALYAAADYCAVPMVENRYSGITVALEAAALGVPVVGTNTGGLHTYFADGEILLAPVGDAVALRELVLAQTIDQREQMARRAQARFIDADYTSRGMVRRYDRLTREVL